MKFLLGLVPNLAGAFGPAVSAVLNPWVLLALLAGAAACFGGGVVVEGWRWDASLTTEANERANALVKQAAENAALAARLQKQLMDERAKRDEDKRKFDDELRRTPKEDLVEVDCPKPDAPRAAALSGAAPDAPSAQRGDRPRVRLSADALRLWNLGLGIGLPEAYGRWRADDEVRGPAAPPVGGDR